MEKVSIKLFILFLFFYISFYIYPVDWKKTISKYGSSICLIEVIDNIGSKVSGSGFVFSKEGFILTNAHVVKMAYFSKDYRIETKFLNSSFSDKIYTGNVIAIDIEKDLAIIKIDRNFDNYCILGDSSKVENMDEILVIGYPLGMGFKSTPGYVQSFQDIKEYGKMLDLSAIVDPGNSGGPVFNKDSEVIGIVTAKFLGYNFNLAIPINHTKDFINASLKSRKIKITSEPSGANVYLGSTSAGKTPLNIEIFGVKNHIKISLDGYLDIEKEIDSSVKNGETINFILEKRSTKIINITSLPSKSNVY
ncbi:MAG TPA: trypsin-like peptidase domain-containing protein, partial [Spirochaetota bacterium]|nr:trypsin-like peptidase domain-containing protein [Spirochaetota bacterium]